MKTFEQFRAWMKDHQAWNEYLSEYYTTLNISSLKKLYETFQIYILEKSFVWDDSILGYEYWENLNKQWKNYFNNMQNYQLVYVNERVACVKMPKQATAIQIGFVKSALQKENPEITDFDWENGCLYGYAKKMKLEKI